MKRVEQLLRATLELEEALRFYERRVPGLGERFPEAVRQVKASAAQNPQLGSPHQRGARKWRVSDFPYNVICREYEDRILIVAIAHGKRRPGDWLRRLGSAR
jgi:plasmid stabilization system protein ParE